MNPPSPHSSRSSFPVVPAVLNAAFFLAVLAGPLAAGGPTAFWEGHKALLLLAVVSGLGLLAWLATAIAPLRNFFSSIKLAVALLILLAVVSIIGTVLAQGESAQDNIRLFTTWSWNFYNKLGLVDTASPESVARYREASQQWGLRLYNLSGKLDFDRLYETWYFNLMLGLLSLNLVVCSLHHWPHTWRHFSHPKLTLEGEGAAGIPMRRELSTRATPPQAAQKALAALAAKGWKPLLTEADGAVHLFAQKGLWGRLGVYVTHLSLLFIFLGAFIGFQYGMKGFMAVEEGQTLDTIRLRAGKGTYKLPFSIRCNDFELTYYERTRRPSDYKSDLTVIEGGKEVVRKTIEVNDPLIYPPSLFHLKSIYFYQSSYGETGKAGTLRLHVDIDGKHVDANVALNGQTRVPDARMAISVMRFVPDFEMRGAEIVSRSNQPNNPAAALRFVMDDGRVFSSWLFRNYPEVNTLAGSGFTAVLADYDGHKYTGLQVAYDPGTWVVWLGCSLMVIGIFMAFFLPHKRVWVKAVPGAKGTAVWVAGSTSRNRATFEDEFDKVALGVKEALAS